RSTCCERRTSASSSAIGSGSVRSTYCADAATGAARISTASVAARIGAELTSPRAPLRLFGAPFCRVRQRATSRPALLYRAGRRVMDAPSRDEKIRTLRRVCPHLRIDILEMITAAGSGHPGGSLSAIDLIETLYRYHLRQG